ncbi:ribosome biogenesis protein BMS1 homolog [Diorhabda sublineata]|uniref:ribosome biogenesis protein BMS1 homolog n=1 Tax=Diorhabda sublineata TaxID=1163346 RepID=UPI0024E1812F|nr:ribosome biogenesis protein BMS1 homolog [Diorhabda sublineata]
MEEEYSTKKKAHRDRHSGRKSEKKKAKKKEENADMDPKQRNPKAFSFNSAVRAERKFRRKEDINTKKQHIPLVDRTPIEPPPIVVTVVGPPKVGKSTVIQNLIKLFTKLPLTEIKGPVTIVTGKKRRITFFECNNDINSMIDLAKVSDLVLLLCDASFGFEMEIFEFLNICQVHGMPRIMGVLTHLDLIKNSKTLKNTKKTLKHRFWTEVYPGAKLFYLSGIIHEEYLRNEVKNLGRFISVMKFRPLQWRTTHSYLIGDRYEDLTNQELIRQNPKCDRNVALYGYIRGVPLKKDSYVHIAGFGDIKIHDLSFLPDPCPLPEELKKRALIEKEKLIYAPFSGVGGIVYDKDAVYMELGGSHSHNKREDDTDNIVTNLISAKETLDEKLKHSELQIFTGGKKLTADDVADSEGDQNSVELYEKKEKKDGPSELDDELDKLRKKCVEVEDNGRIRRKVIFDDVLEDIGDSEDADSNTDIDDGKDIGETFHPAHNKDIEIHSKVKDILGKMEFSEKRKLEDQQSSECSDDQDNDDEEFDSENENNEIKWKENLMEKAKESFLQRQSTNKNLMRLVYDFQEEEEDSNNKNDEIDDEEELGGLFRKVSKNQHNLKQSKDVMNLTESSLTLPWNVNMKDWTHPDNKELIKNCFITGKWKDSEDARELLKLDEAPDLSDGDSEVFGDFEDLETGETHTAQTQLSKIDKGEKRKREESDNKEDVDALAEKKKKLKEKFDSEYDSQEKLSYYDELKLSAEKQAQLNKTVFENVPDDIRVQIEGFRPGMYVRMEFQGVPSEFLEYFDPTYPLVIGALNMGEENVGFLNVKIKKHRWYKKILKTNDPLIISLGWRRFQTIPLYSKLEDDLKFRYLKYTPEHLTCNAHFWGPITPQGTGFLALQTVDSQSGIIKNIGFRIAATGSVLELDKNTRILKKLKLIGHPLKIYKKTAFIKGMFNSALEVAKFESARIKTVSGIRGQIKKAVNKPEGCFRATFEDKILLSDIVFCRTWFKVDVPKFYAPVNTLLFPSDKRNSWRGVRTTGEIKRDKGIQNEANKDSLYTPIEREAKPFKPLIVPKKLQEALPYRDKPKHIKPSDKNPLDRVAVIVEPEEQKISTMMKMLRASYNKKQEKIKQETKERLEKHRQEIESVEANRLRKLKDIKKNVHRMKSKQANSKGRKK